MKCACPAYFALYSFFSLVFSLWPCAVAVVSLCVLYVQLQLIQYGGVAFVYLILNRCMWYGLLLSSHCHLFIQFHSDCSSIRFIHFFHISSILKRTSALSFNTIKLVFESQYKICMCVGDRLRVIYVMTMLKTFSMLIFPRFCNGSVSFVLVH